MTFHPTAQRFAFDRVFAMPGTGGKVAEDVIRPDVKAELEALRAEMAVLREAQAAALSMARHDGFEAGLTHARGEREVALLSAVDALQGAIEQLDDKFGSVEDRLTGEAAETALAAADILAARALSIPGAAVDAAIGRVLGQVARGTELLVRVHPDMIDDIDARIVARQAGDRRRLRITVASDDTLAIGDGQISWDQGALTLDAAQRRLEILAELETLLPK